MEHFEFVSFVLSLINTVVVIGSALFALIQWTYQCKIRRSQYLQALSEKMRTDEQIMGVRRAIDYGHPWYDEDFHIKHGNSFVSEDQIDETLAFYSYLCYLKIEKVISKKEFKFFSYNIDRALQNRDMQGYLFNLYHFSRKNGMEMSFQSLFEYGQEKGLFKKDFFDSSTGNKQYPRYLNF